MGTRLKAKKSEGRVCLWFPRERKWRTENTERRASLLLRKPGHPASPGQGPLDTFPPAALRKQTRHCAERSSIHASAEYGHPPSAGYLFLKVRIHFMWTPSKHTPKEELSNFILYLLTEQQNHSGARNAILPLCNKSGNIQEWNHHDEKYLDLK